MLPRFAGNGLGAKDILSTTAQALAQETSPRLLDKHTVAQSACPHTMYILLHGESDRPKTLLQLTALAWLSKNDLNYFTPPRCPPPLFEPDISGTCRARLKPTTKVDKNPHNHWLARFQQPPIHRVTTLWGAYFFFPPSPHRGVDHESCFPLLGRPSCQHHVLHPSRSWHQAHAWWRFRWWSQERQPGFSRLESCIVPRQAWRSILVARIRWRSWFRLRPTTTAPRGPVTVRQSDSVHDRKRRVGRERHHLGKDARGVPRRRLALVSRLPATKTAAQILASSPLRACKLLPVFSDMLFAHWRSASPRTARTRN